MYASGKYVGVAVYVYSGSSFTKILQNVVKFYKVLQNFTSENFLLFSALIRKKDVLELTFSIIISYRV